jgi:hypothetical protein
MNEYGYAKVEYVCGKSDVVVTCFSHGDFLISPRRHLNGVGCPVCSSDQKDSKGIKKITKFFEKYKVRFNREVRFQDCRNNATNRTLPFDFQIFVGARMAIVEFNGRQHFEETQGSFWDRVILKDIQVRDSIKRDYLRANGIPLLDIAYTEEDQIEDLLWNFITALRKGTHEIQMAQA